MKSKVILSIVAITMLFSFAACSSNDNMSDAILDEDLDIILNTIYENISAPDFALMTNDITAETSDHYLGIDQMEFQQALASEPIMSTIPYCVCLIRVSEGANVPSIEADIRDNIDLSRWTTTIIEPSDMIIDHIGNVILVAISPDYATAIHESFLKLAE